MQLYNHSQINTLALKNVNIYPSNYTTLASRGTTLFWGNLNFQFIVDQKRVWQFQGSGFTDQNQVEIIYIINSPYHIKFEDTVSGTVSSSNDQKENIANDRATLISITENDKEIVKISIQCDQPLYYFAYDINKKDGNSDLLSPLIGG